MSIASEEIQQQLDRIVALGYPDVADMSANAFRKLANPISVSYTHLTLPTSDPG